MSTLKILRSVTAAAVRKPTSLANTHLRRETASRRALSGLGANATAMVAILAFPKALWLCSSKPDQIRPKTYGFQRLGLRSYPRLSAPIRAYPRLSAAIRA